MSAEPRPCSPLPSTGGVPFALGGTGERAWPCRRDRDAPVRNDATPELVARLRVVDGYRPVDDAARSEHDPAADPRAFGDDAAGADHGVVAYEHRRRLRRFEHAAD